MSNLVPLLRITAFVLSFTYNCHSETRKIGEIDVLERGNAMVKWMRDVQNEEFRAIDGLPLNNANYAVCIDLLKKRFGQKQLVVNAYMDAVMKFPILLPKGHVFTKLIVFKTHGNVFHGGVRETLTEVRQRFWIPQGRRVIRSNIRNCVTCLKINGKPYQSSDPPPPSVAYV